MKEKNVRISFRTNQKTKDMIVKLSLKENRSQNSQLQTICDDHHSFLTYRKKDD